MFSFPQASIGLKNKRLHMRQRFCCYQVFIWCSVSCLILYPPTAGSPPLNRHLAFWLPLKQSSSWGLLSHTHIFTHSCWERIKNLKKYLHHGTLTIMGHSSKLTGTTKIALKRGCASAGWRETFNFKMRYLSQTN